ncbi:MAG: DNA repair protein RecO [Bacteriovoracaceae bacterium]|nr:DNA repair protein RecO [Bacteriovoracaceae bacterium]
MAELSMRLEGIIIHKTVYKERDLICKILLRDGGLASIYFYGGKGGGKKNKGTILEIGFMVKVLLAPRRKKLEQELQIAQEWDLLWESKQVRQNFRAFYLVSFFCEFLQKVAPKKDFDYDDQENMENEGLFKVASNALFFIEQALAKDNFHAPNHLLKFLTKMAYHLGVAPDFSQCVHCYGELETYPSMRFEPNNGGFSCSECANSISKMESQSATELRSLLQNVLETPYKDWESIAIAERGPCEATFRFLCFQFQWQPSNFISYAMIF